MKSFKQLLAESMAELINEATIGDIWRNPSNSHLSSFEKRLSNNSSHEEIDRILARLTAAQLGGLIGECINIFRDYKEINFISVIIPNERNANYSIANISEEEISKIEIRNKDNIIISRKYIKENFPRRKSADIIKNILNKPTSYVFASYADPVPHKITAEMAGKQKIYDYEETQTFDRETRLHKTVRTKKDSGETKDVNTLKLFTTNTGAGITQGSKRGSAVDTDRESRKTLTIQNFYTVNDGAYCVQIKDYPVYAFSIKRAKDAQDNQAFRGSPTRAKGAVDNVYIKKDDIESNMYTSDEFLQHLAKELSGGKRSYNRSSETKLGDLNTRTMHEGQNKEVFELISQVNQLIPNPRENSGMGITSTAKRKCKELYNMILDKYGTRVPTDIYRQLPLIIKDAIKEKQKMNRNRINVSAAFRKR
jgi:hypothetical protein